MRRRPNRGVVRSIAAVPVTLGLMVLAAAIVAGAGPTPLATARPPASGAGSACVPTPPIERSAADASGAADPTGGAPAVPMGWQLVSMPAAGFMMSFPPDWTVIDLTAGDVDLLLEELSSGNPALAAVTRSFLESGQAISLLAAAPLGVGDEFLDSVNVIRSGNTGLSPGAIGDLTVAQLKGLPNIRGEIWSEEAVVAGAPGLHLGYGVSLFSADSPGVDYCVEQYVAVTDEMLWVFTYSYQDPSSAVFDEVARTIELTP